MAEASIPVNLFNPGQVFACLGFLEAADVLLGDAVGGFDWSNEADVRFRLRAKGNENPFGVVLGFLAGATLHEDTPALADTFPGPEADEMTLPIRLIGSINGQEQSVRVTHWADASSRNDFKLYSGNRSAASIARAMLSGTRDKPKKNQSKSDVKTRCVSALWKDSRGELIKAPFDVLTPTGGSFNFDPRGAWTGIDAGYSPNDQGHSLAASPVIEILAAIGLEHARPDEYKIREVRYGTWGELLPPLLARPALAGTHVAVPVRRFRFTLDLSGKNKVITFSQEEINP
jgi:CRISPR-associated protein Csb3